MYQNAEEGPTYQTNMPGIFFKQHFDHEIQGQR